MNPIYSIKDLYFKINFNNVILHKLGLFPLRIPNKILYGFLISFRVGIPQCSASLILLMSFFNPYPANVDNMASSYQC
jgi:hypothetical protein